MHIYSIIRTCMC